MSLLAARQKGALLFRGDRFRRGGELIGLDLFWQIGPDRALETPNEAP